MEQMRVDINKDIAGAMKGMLENMPASTEVVVKSEEVSSEKKGK